MTFLILLPQLTILYSIALIGVVGATGACGPAFCVYTPNVSLTCHCRHAYPQHWKASTCSPYHGILLLAVCTSFYPRVCLTRVLQMELLTTCFRMILFKLPLVIPTRTSWLVMLLLIGIFGFVGQVCYSILAPLSTHSLTRPLLTYKDTFNDGTST